MRAQQAHISPNNYPLLHLKYEKYNIVTEETFLHATAEKQPVLSEKISKPMYNTFNKSTKCSQLTNLFSLTKKILDATMLDIDATAVTERLNSASRIVRSSVKIEFFYWFGIPAGICFLLLANKCFSLLASSSCVIVI